MTTRRIWSFRCLNRLEGCRRTRARLNPNQLNYKRFFTTICLDTSREPDDCPSSIIDHRVRSDWLFRGFTLGGSSPSSIHHSAPTTFDELVRPEGLCHQGKFGVGGADAAMRALYDVVSIFAIFLLVSWERSPLGWILFPKSKADAPDRDPFYVAPSNLSSYHEGQPIRSRPATSGRLFRNVGAVHQVLYRTNDTQHEVCLPFFSSFTFLCFQRTVCWQ